MSLGGFLGQVLQALLQHVSWPTHMLRVPELAALPE